MSFKSTLLGAVAVVAIASTYSAPASAAVGTNPVYGAGSTLVDNVYRALFNCVGENGTGGLLGTQTCSPGTETAPVSGAGVMEILYAGIGSGSGQNDYLTNTTTFGSTPSNTGLFQDTAAGYTYPYAKFTFGAGDVPLTATQLAQTAISGHSVVVGSGLAAGPAIQVPTLITSVTVPIHASTLDGLAGLAIPTDAQGTPGSSGLVLTRDQLCGIFNGDIADWSDSRLTQSNGKTPSSSAKGIKVVIRHDSSGTTGLMSNALVTQCAASAHPMNSAWGSPGTSYFVNAVPRPATWKDENTDLGFGNGSEGIADSVAATDGAVSYLSPDFALPFHVGTHIASPTANIVNKSGTVVPPTPYSASLIMASAPSATSADSAATWGTKGVNADPAGLNSYDIGGYTWIYLYTCYANLQDFIDVASGSQPGTWGWYYGATGQADVTAILSNNGFARIPNSWLRNIRDLLFSNANTKIRFGASAGVCTGGV